VNILGPSFICRVRRGQVSFWHDKWIYNVYLCNVVPYVHISDTNIRLRDLHENEDWNFKKLYTHLPSFCQDCICSITINHDTNDKLIWSSSPNGIYSARHGYRWLDRDPTQHLATTGWSWIWRLSISEDLRHFCWVVMHVVFLLMHSEIYAILPPIPHVIDVMLLLRMICILFVIAQAQWQYGRTFIILILAIFTCKTVKFSLNTMLLVKHALFSL